MGNFSKWLQTNKRLDEMTADVAGQKSDKAWGQVSSSQFQGQSKLTGFMLRVIDTIQKKNPKANKGRIVAAMKAALAEIESGHNEAPQEQPPTPAPVA